MQFADGFVCFIFLLVLRFINFALTKFLSCIYDYVEERTTICGVLLIRIIQIHFQLC